jgi:hypothetical protein
MPYICGECHKSGGSRSRRSHGHGGHKKSGKRKSSYQACMARELHKTKTADPQMRMKLAVNACARLGKKNRK